MLHIEYKVFEKISCNYIYIMILSAIIMNIDEAR